MNSPRTKEDFDRWLTKHGGDPWGYDSSFVQERLKKSLLFLNKNIPEKFKGTFVEFGAFDGSFTSQLAEKYSSATVFAVEISEVAFLKLNERTRYLKNVKTVLTDMTESAAKLNLKSDEKIVILLFECLYYLPIEEQKIFIKTLKQKLPSAKLFLSAPVTGGRYYTEKNLIAQMKSAGYHLKSLMVLNYTRVPLLSRVTSVLMNHFFFLRKKFAHQQIFLFVPSLNISN